MPDKEVTCLVLIHECFGSEATKEAYKAVNGLVDYRVPPWSLEMSFDGSLRGYMTP